MTDLYTLVDRPMLFVGAATVSFPIYICIGTVLFDSWEHFLDSLRLWYQPGWLSALRGEWNEDNWESMRLLLYFACCAAAATSVYKLAKHLF
jgi:hypothetical protein